MDRRDAPSPYPLFGLQTLKNSSVFDAFIITEGEKCASILHQLGWAAISPALGAQNPGKTDWNPCRYYNRFIILRDNDKAGILFAQKVSAEIKRIHPACELFVVNFTPEMKGGDLVDWLQSTILRGQNWNGFDSIEGDKIPFIKLLLFMKLKNYK
jgi:DNA primase